MDNEEKLLYICAEIYEDSRDGKTSVIKYLEGLDHPDWGYCEDCECKAPFVHRNKENKCLICSFGNILE